VPNGDPATILDRALDALIATTEQRRFGAGARRKAASTLTLPATLPAGTKERRRSRAIPATVRREVFERDGGACAFVDAGGKRCGCTSAVELHHVVPFAMGGAHSAENLRVYCRAHNQRQGERDFGPRV
jgi:5-methylcytosine-specific restriction endonuclease McrA